MSNWAKGSGKGTGIMEVWKLWDRTSGLKSCHTVAIGILSHAIKIPPCDPLIPAWLFFFSSKIQDMRSDRFQSRIEIFLVVLFQINLTPSSLRHGQGQADFLCVVSKPSTSHISHLNLSNLPLTPESPPTELLFHQQAGTTTISRLSYTKLCTGFNLSTSISFPYFVSVVLPRCLTCWHVSIQTPSRLEIRSRFKDIFTCVVRPVSLYS